VPEYEGRVVFVEAITTDPAARDVLERYQVRYIPTSVFIGSDGEVSETFVGPAGADRMRQLLDALLTGAE
jgi:thioredoxin-like negative regulator of GroEL